VLDILWLARSIPLPLSSGDKLYTGKLASSISEAGASLRYVGLADEPCSPPGPDLAPRIQWIIVPGSRRSTLAGALSKEPMVGARYGTTAYRKTVRDQLRTDRPDVVVLDQYGLAFVLGELLRAGYRGPVVHIAHDFETLVTRDLARAYNRNWLRKFALALNARKTESAERRLALGSQLVVTLTERDAAEFRRIGARKTLVVPPGYDRPIIFEPWSAKERTRRVAIIGSFEWTAKQVNLSNFLLAADQRFAAAGISIDVVGRVPEPLRTYLQPRLHATKFHGFVDDLGAIFRHSRFGLIIEETGGGFKLKTLDYVFNGLPVAALNGSFEGVPPEVAVHFLVERDVSSLSGAIVATIDNDERLQTMRAGALSAASDKFDWGIGARNFISAVKDLR
jgi:glycosyltransferase involved in cell wall biosynthesis